jgi:hypothetical protein
LGLDKKLFSIRINVFRGPAPHRGKKVVNGTGMHCCGDSHFSAAPVFCILDIFPFCSFLIIDIFANIEGMLSEFIHNVYSNDDFKFLNAYRY